MMEVGVLQKTDVPDEMDHSRRNVERTSRDELTGLGPAIMVM